MTGFQHMLRTIAGLCTIVAMGIADPRAVAAQICEIPDAALALAPPDPPAVYAYDAPAPEPEPLFDAVLGVGHAYHAPSEPAMGPPGDNSWLQRVALPLSESPGSAPSAWIARGWIVEPGKDPEALTIWGLLETGYEERSFVVLERRNDGWLRIRYAVDERGPRSAWVPACALEASPAPLAFAPWSDWLLGDDVSPLFVRAGLPLALHTEPSRTSSLIAMISIDDGLEPHEIRGEWMRVTLVQPSGYCRPEVASTRREGWVRWLTEDDRGPRLWYFTRGC
jgi:hypothetical protein